MVYFLVNECKINPADKTSDGWDALLLLCHYYDGHSNNDLKVILDFLIDDCGVDPSQENRAYKYESSNAFLLACHHYRGSDLKQVLEVLIDKGGYDVNKTPDLSYKNSNALHILCSSFDTDWDDHLLQLVTFLVYDKGINVDASDADGWNSLHLLCTAYRGSQFGEIVNFLCDKGIDINQLTSEGFDAVYLRLHRVNHMSSSLEDVKTLVNRIGFDVKSFLKNSNHELLNFFLRIQGSDFNDILELLYDKGFLDVDDVLMKTAELECKILLVAGILYRGPRLLDMATRIINQVRKRYLACAECWIMEDNEEARRRASSLKNLLKKTIATALIELGVFNLDLNREDVIKYLKTEYDGMRTASSADDGPDSSDFLNGIELVEQSGFVST